MNKAKLNIAVVSDAVLPFNKGGKETRIFHLTNALADKGHTIDIYTMKWWDGDNKIKIGNITYHAISKFYPLYSGDRRSIKQGIMFGLAGFKMLRYKFDLLEVDHMPFFPLFSTKIVSLLKAKPLYATWHEVWGKQYWDEYLGGFSAWLAWNIERLSVHAPDHIIAVSNATKQKLITQLHFKGPIDIVPNGIDTLNVRSIAHSKLTSDVIFAGRLLPHKNVDMLIYAIAMLKADMPHIKAVIIGEGPQFGQLSSLIKQLGLSRNIRMLGRVEDSAQVISIMKSSKMFILPSTREGFGISVLEAFACGLPVITVSHKENAARFLVRGNKGIVCKPTPEDIAASIHQLLSSPQAYLSITVPNQYRWDQSANKLTRVYNQ